ncbi:hypothetical protein GRX01_09980 [Halobaculum sp. WSA2]|uniref:Uncharacterized protein n=1 Tax=Halobaculum saliterrae TaxID=2073113 RepID=A0A6B0SYF8_9EURY|nr:hypothetical protein [Halobaculum saliterrae]MXR41663.1 hypothetical protein [Halobaculum saliterrae]
MPLKRYGVGDDLSVIGRWADGFSWVAHPDEEFERTSHAIAVGADDGGDGDDCAVWLVDPIDADGLDAEIAEFGSVAGVLVLSDNHCRHAARVADRHGVRVFVHEHLGDLAVDAETTEFTGGPAATGFRTVPVVSRLWREVALYHPGQATLVVGDALTTMDSHTNPGERLAVMPHLRLVPPTGALGGLPVNRVLVGHGSGVHRNAADALKRALGGARRGAPRAILGTLPELVRNAYVTLRD